MSDSRRGRGRRQGPWRHHKKGPSKNDGPAANLHDDAFDASPSPQIGTPRVATPPLTEPVPMDTPRFADLAGQNLVHPTVIQTITDDLKFDHMMPVQAATLHELLPPKRSDCLVQAKTGTGKTVAFLLPAIQTILSQKRTRKSGISLLVIAPTRELAMQIAKEARALLQRIPSCRVCIAIGGTNKNKEENQILAGCDILVATPGRLYDHMSNEMIKDMFSSLDTLVLDEADRLLDMGFLNELKKIISCLPDKRETNRQGMLFSATVPPHVRQVAALALSPGYSFISTIPEGEVNTHQRVPQHLVKVPTFAAVAPAMVAAVKEEMGVVGHAAFKAIVFAPTAAAADFYSHVLSSLAAGLGLPPVSTLHARISQNTRTRVTNAYRDAANGILVATDVVARGMDFPGVTTVFQVGIPADKESYIHRLGRTARAGAEGRGILIVSEAEDFFPRWTLKEISFVARDVDTSATAAAAVEDIAARMDDAQRAKIYQAWLGYYNNYLKPLRWDKEYLVAQANIYARDALGAAETPSLQKSTVGKMGLRGVRGLVVVPDAPRAHRGQGGGGEGRSAGSGGRGRRGGGRGGR
ncbi:uncharacterized protein E0L32_009753 [Thyridium curvatum]|uniref:ATP-dependent RNA helicase n=1 Tax=Thyridium curvatum TaxID=1093900 RepID=A0A507AMC7_9PEZI|nr:uncharacterized protein E0L32_009753 [Thyridium curvatum]TPX08813.1 hypothetical protein E0L32_009753 [Thyridium curvatum]